MEETQTPVDSQKHKIHKRIKKMRKVRKSHSGAKSVTFRQSVDCIEDDEYSSCSSFEFTAPEFCDFDISNEWMEPSTEEIKSEPTILEIKQEPIPEPKEEPPKEEPVKKLTREALEKLQTAIPKTSFSEFSNRPKIAAMSTIHTCSNGQPSTQDLLKWKQLVSHF